MLLFSYLSSPTLLLHAPLFGDPLLPFLNHTLAARDLSRRALERSQDCGLRGLLIRRLRFRLRVFHLLHGVGFGLGSGVIA